MKLEQLELDETAYQTEEQTLGKESVAYRAYTNLVYVANPVDRTYQSLNIYVPQAYCEGGSIGPYSRDTAPIFMPNTVGGYMPGPADHPGSRHFGRENTILRALCHGYVVVSPGIRGRGCRDAEGRYTGVAPACIVDYKAAVRYIRHNREKLPGDTEKIISNGTSAGGALSALLGATGNHPDYEPYLEELGAARERDDIFYASCYCPITNLEHADMAYEWEFFGVPDYHRMKPEPCGEAPGFRMIPEDGVLTEWQQTLSERERALFPAYVNGLGLTNAANEPLTLNHSGGRTLREEISRCVLAAAQREIDRGADLSGVPCLTVENGCAAALDWDGFIRYRTRMKEVPTFDSISLDTPENELFGAPQIKCRHFTPLSKQHSSADGKMAEARHIKLMNPMRYIHDSLADQSPYFRIRHGAADRDTSLAIPTLLAAALRDGGIHVDYQIPWGIAHAGDYDLPALFRTIDETQNIGI